MSPYEADIEVVARTVPCPQPQCQAQPGRMCIGWSLRDYNNRVRWSYSHTGRLLAAGFVIGAYGRVSHVSAITA